MRKCITTSMIHGAHKATQLLSHEKAGKAYEGSLLLGYCEALYGGMHLKAYAASVHHNTYIVGEEVSHEQLYYKYKHCHRVSHIGLEAF